AVVGRGLPALAESPGRGAALHPGPCLAAAITQPLPEGERAAVEGQGLPRLPERAVEHGEVEKSARRLGGRAQLLPGGEGFLVVTEGLAAGLRATGEKQPARFGGGAARDRLPGIRRRHPQAIAAERGGRLRGADLELPGSRSLGPEQQRLVSPTAVRAVDGEQR